MKVVARFTVALASAACLAFAAGCSKSVAPPTDASSTHQSETAALAGDRAAPREFVARMVFSGSTIEFGPGWRPRERRGVWYVYSRADVGARIDTIPANARLQRIEWGNGRSGAVVTHLDLTLGVGTHLIDQPSPRPDGGVVSFACFVGFEPVAWFAGPEPRLWPASPDGDGRSVEVSDWATFDTPPGWPPDGRRWFGPDSFAYVPSQRTPVARNFDRRTFYEILGNRIWARSEGDTVHYFSTLVFVTGGFDRDTKYVPRVVSGDPALPAGWEGDLSRYAVLNAQDRIGSPIAFRYRFQVRPPGGGGFQSAMSGAYPVFDPASVFRAPNLCGYVRPMSVGWWYVQVRAEDADGLMSPIGPFSRFAELADEVDAGGGTRADRLIRRSILKFYVKSPDR
ncbi:MAG: hypothetical protein U0704_15285 [Candidatus Eisenbacteria bacterium]